MFTAKLVTWVVGDTGKQGRRTASEQDEAETAAATAALRTQLAEMRADVDRLMKAADYKEG